MKRKVPFALFDIGNFARLALIVVAMNKNSAARAIPKNKAGDHFWWKATGGHRRRRFLRVTLIVAAIATTTGVAFGGTFDSAPANASEAQPQCDRGEFCLWNKPGFTGDDKHFDLRSANPGDCIPLGDGFIAHSLANRASLDLAVYEDDSCSDQKYSTVYPSEGSFVPSTAHPIHAIRIIENEGH